MVVAEFGSATPAKSPVEAAIPGPVMTPVNRPTDGAAGHVSGQPTTRAAAVAALKSPSDCGSPTPISALRRVSLPAEVLAMYDALQRIAAEYLAALQPFETASPDTRAGISPS